MKKVLLGLTGIVCLVSSCAVLKRDNTISASLSIESAASQSEPYDKLITKEAITQKGLFYVHQIGSKYYFEIPDSLLQREMLVVTRFIKTPAGAVNYGGEEIGEKTLIWEKGPNNKIFLRILTLVSRADEEDAISIAVNNSSVTPIMEAFDIKAVNGKAKSHVIDVTDFINGDNRLLALSDRLKDEYNLTSLERDKSYIQAVDAYPINMEIKTVKTYRAKDSKKGALPAAMLAGTVTLEINNSLILLPKVPMKRRYYDDRVGYFASSHWEYGDEQQRVDRNTYIHRWRLEPRAEDVEKWKRGVLVEPKKPIIFYIDPATPKKWRPYLIQGINDWQKAFEQAGFKNAIVGKEWPEEAEGMSLEDARFSVVRYFASPVKNAYGPNIVDPRSGEIIESHVGWYHNVMNLLHNWYMIQAGASDPRARTMKFDDELMGELIRVVSSHEVGHTLGLRHNMGASHATPVERLRDRDWLETYGHTSSIMDYARFNYVAQPEDSVSMRGLIPEIGDYDKWAIQWGYTGFPSGIGEEEEQALLNQWVIDSISANPRLWFGGEGKNMDPRSQTEDLGDNAMIASYYGIKNLQRILPQLTEWTKERGTDNFETLEEVYQDVVKQYNRYLTHVVKNIGGIYATPKTVNEPGEVFLPVPKETQKEALAFLDRYIFQEPGWLLHEEILNKIESPQSKSVVTKTMESVMITLLEGGRISRMEFTSNRYANHELYRPEEYIDDLSDLVWKELERHSSINSYRRCLQKAYVSNMLNLYNPSDPQGSFVEVLLAKLSESETSHTDVRPIALSNLLTLQNKIKRSIPLTIDPMTRSHLQYVLLEIESAIGEDTYRVEGYPIRALGYE